MVPTSKSSWFHPLLRFFFSLCVWRVCVWVCVTVCMLAHVNTGTYMKIREKPWVSVLAFHLRQDPLSFAAAHTGLQGHMILPSASHLLVCNNRHLCFCIQLLWGLGDLNSVWQSLYNKCFTHTAVSSAPAWPFLKAPWSSFPLRASDLAQYYIGGQIVVYKCCCSVLS